jgi:tRNA U34 5-carboxymethylaminomethyl modifying enzyme MnmG/GidA
MLAGDALSSEFISGNNMEANRRPLSPASSGTGRLLSRRMNLHFQGLRTGQEGRIKTEVRDLHDLAERTSQWTLHSDIVPLYDNAACVLRPMCHVYRTMIAGIILVPE